VGREFAFPIDYCKDKHWELTSTPAEIQSYSKTLAQQLSASSEVAKLLIEESRAYHREYINSLRPDPKIYAIGDMVFPRRAIKSVASRGQVAKLQFAYTGPW
jgi:NADH dehydrogenase FAD-containing subunit